MDYYWNSLGKYYLKKDSRELSRILSSPLEPRPIPESSKNSGFQGLAESVLSGLFADGSYNSIERRPHE